MTATSDTSPSLRSLEEGARRPSLSRWSMVVAAAVTSLLVAMSGGYGYHRDELYFLRAGKDLAWGYPDQPPLTPLLARLADELAPGSLVLLRLPSALAIGAIVLLAALMARELGGGRRAQDLAAASCAVGTVFLIPGHLLSTTTFDLLVWTALTYLVLRLLRGADPRLWWAVGAVAGVGLLNKQLVAFLLAGLALSLLAVGPRELLRSRAVWGAAAVALLLWSPHLVWQAQHGWPALEVASSVSAGASTSSEPRSLFLPFQLVLVSPFLVPVWALGLRRLWRARELRALALTYPLLAVLFLVTGGKPYYLAGLYPLLLAAGAQPVVLWAGSARARAGLVVVSVGASAVISAVLALPVIPAERVAGTLALALNEDAAETIGWPDAIATVAAVHRATGGNADILTANYGEAGAVDRYGSEYGLPPAYSGHNGYADWGPPPETTRPVVVVGLDAGVLDAWFRDCRLAARIDNRYGVVNEEAGAPVHVCEGRREPWTELWPDIRRLG